MDPFKQICHAPTEGDLWCPWLGQGFQYLGLEVSLLLIAIERGDKVKMTFWGINPHGKDLCIPMEVFAICFKKCLYTISKGHGSNVNMYWFCQMLCQWHCCFQHGPNRSFVGNISKI
jgi:hypothetical protein